MKAHFFDLDTLINIDSKPWIITKNDPSKPIMKISRSDFNIIKSGLYRSHNNKIDFNGNIFWLPNDLMGKLMVKIKKENLNLSELAISLREFIDEDFINQANVEYDLRVVSNLKNSLDDVYIICPKETKKTHQVIIDTLESKLAEFGVNVKSFYHISETFFDQTSDGIEYKKMRLFVQHLLGYKTENDVIIDKEITRYDTLTYYGNDKTTLSYADKINQVTRTCFNKSEEVMKSVVKEDLIDYKPIFNVNFITDNQFNKVIVKTVPIVLNAYIQAPAEYKKSGN